MIAGNRRPSNFTGMRVRGYQVSKFSKQDQMLLGIGALIVASGVLLAFLNRPVVNAKVGPTVIEQSTPAPTANRENPRLVGFRGDLKLGGLPSHTDKPQPFVIGETLTLDVEAVKVDAFRWFCNDELLENGGKAWAEDPKREFNVEKAGAYLFRVEGRAGEHVLPPLEKTIHAYAVKIKEFDSDIMSVGSSNKFLTGDTISLQVTMVEPMQQMTYEFRYFLNSKVIKPESGQSEWTESDSLVYTLKTPGEYRFKVEARRKNEPVAEDSMGLTCPIRVGDAVIFDLDAEPEKTAVVGDTVKLSVVVWNEDGPTECRFGVMDMRKPSEGYTWIPSGAGNEWGSPERDWIPQTASIYEIRAEVRDSKGKEADDIEKLVYNVTPKKEDF